MSNNTFPKCIICNLRHRPNLDVSRCEKHIQDGNKPPKKESYNWQRVQELRMIFGRSPVIIDEVNFIELAKQAPIKPVDDSDTSSLSE